jgi:hypothetical protein
MSNNVGIYRCCSSIYNIFIKYILYFIVKYIKNTAKTIDTSHPLDKVVR